MQQDNRQPAPNYTDACIVMFGINLGWVLLLVWALHGLVAVALTGLAVNHAIDRIDARRRGASRRATSRGSSA